MFGYPDDNFGETLRTLDDWLRYQKYKFEQNQIQFPQLPTHKLAYLLIEGSHKNQYQCYYPLYNHINRRLKDPYMNSFPYWTGLSSFNHNGTPIIPIHGGATIIIYKHSLLKKLIDTTIPISSLEELFQSYQTQLLYTTEWFPQIELISQYKEQFGFQPQFVNKSTLILNGQITLSNIAPQQLLVSGLPYSIDQHQSTLIASLFSNHFMRPMITNVSQIVHQTLHQQHKSTHTLTQCPNTPIPIPVFPEPNPNQSIQQPLLFSLFSPHEHYQPTLQFQQLLSLPLFSSKTAQKLQHEYQNDQYLNQHYNPHLLTFLTQQHLKTTLLSKQQFNHSLLKKNCFQSTNSIFSSHQSTHTKSNQQYFPAIRLICCQHRFQVGQSYSTTDTDDFTNEIDITYNQSNSLTLQSSSSSSIIQPKSIQSIQSIEQPIKSKPSSSSTFSFRKLFSSSRHNTTSPTIQQQQQPTITPTTIPQNTIEIILPLELYSFQLLPCTFLAPDPNHLQQSLIRYQSTMKSLLSQSTLSSTSSIIDNHNCQQNVIKNIHCLGSDLCPNCNLRSIGIHTGLACNPFIPPKSPMVHFFHEEDPNSIMQQLYCFNSMNLLSLASFPTDSSRTTSSSIDIDFNNTRQPKQIQKQQSFNDTKTTYNDTIEYSSYYINEDDEIIDLFFLEANLDWFFVLDYDELCSIMSIDRNITHIQPNNDTDNQYSSPSQRSKSFASFSTPYSTVQSFYSPQQYLSTTTPISSEMTQFFANDDCHPYCIYQNEYFSINHYQYDIFE